MRLLSPIWFMPTLWNEGFHILPAAGAAATAAVAVSVATAAIDDADAVIECHTTMK